MFLLVAIACIGIQSAASAYAITPHVLAEVDTSSCAACHDAHASPGGALLRGEPSLIDAGGSCFVCHDGSDSAASNIATGELDSFGLASGHSFGSAPGDSQIDGCATCHDAHGDTTERRRIPARQVNGTAVSSASKDLCFACHGSDEAWFGPGYPSTSMPTRDATGYPIAGTWTGSSTYESTSNAHRLIPGTTQTVGVSEPIGREQGDCLYCHAAHRGANSYDGLLTTYTVPSQATLASDQANGAYATLCFTCHGGATPSGFATAPVDIKQFATAPGGAGGHAIVTSGGVLPVGSPLPCFECHNPHGSKRGNVSLITDERGAALATAGTSGVRAFCFTCHTTSDTTAGWDSDVSTFTPVTSADKIVGLDRSGGVLHLTNAGGHAQSDAASCYECHGDSYASDGRNVHNPGDGAAVRQAASMVTSVSVPASASVDATVSVELTASAMATGGVAVLEPLVDVTPPVTTSDVQPTYVASATILLSAVDDTAGTGVDVTYFMLDGGEVSSGTVVSTSTVGQHTLTFWSVDFAGNEESPPTTVVFTVSDAVFARVFAVRSERVIADGGG